MERSTVSLIAD